MSEVIAGIRIPDSELAREVTDLLREHGTPLLLARSLRVYLFGAIRGLAVDHGLLYFGAVFHDLGLTAKYRSPDLQATYHHGMGQGSDVEARALQEMLRAAWALLTVEQHVAFFERPEITTLKKIPEYGRFRHDRGRRAAMIPWNARLPPGGT
jgi:hypothetical protein